ncbi:MAG: hypothetical protein Q8S26_15615 [Azonexus sp.]|nr:hypothetical protein [Azonexus sp.]
MHPIHDIDALLLLATAMSSKRRPAEIVEIVAAVDLLQDNIPTEPKLVEAFSRLSTHGLITEVEGRFALTAEAQKIIQAQPRKADTAEKLFGIKDGLSEHNAKGNFASIVLTDDQFRAAIVAHRAAAASTAKNMLVPKPKPEDKSVQKPGQRQRKPMPARRRKP